MYEVFINVGGKILTWILPYLIKKADKYIPIFLDDLINMVLNKREEKVESDDSTKGRDVKMATLKITVETEAEVLIEGATLSTTINGTTVDYTTDTTGSIEKSGFTSGESYTFTAVKTGYTTNTVTVTASDDGVVSGVIKMAVVVETASTPVSTTETVSSTTDTTDEATLTTLLAEAKSLAASLTTAVSDNSVTEATTAVTNIKTKVLAQLTSWSDECQSKYDKTSDPIYKVRWGIEIIVLKAGIYEVNSAIAKAIAWITKKIESL